MPYKILHLDMILPMSTLEVYGKPSLNLAASWKQLRMFARLMHPLFQSALHTHAHVHPKWRSNCLLTLKSETSLERPPSVCCFASVGAYSVTSLKAPSTLSFASRTTELPSGSRKTDHILRFRPFLSNTIIPLFENLKVIEIGSQDPCDGDPGFTDVKIST